MFGLRKNLGSLFKSSKLDEAWFDTLEESLIQSDVGLPTTEQLILKLRKAAKLEKASSPEALQTLLIEEVSTLFMLRKKVWGLHVDFFTAADQSTSE